MTCSQPLGYRSKPLSCFLIFILASQPVLLGAQARAASAATENIPPGGATSVSLTGEAFSPLPTSFDDSLWWDGFGPPDQGGLGLDDTAWAMTVHDDRLVVGGDFTVAGGVAANRIAAWDDGTLSWSTFGSGMDSSVRALALFGGDLIAGGYFTNAGGTAVNGIARWDGGQWQSMAGGMPFGNVLALAIYQGDLIAAGTFTTAGGVACNNIARWDGNEWFPLAEGLQGLFFAQVYDLAVFEGDLVAGGWFQTAGSQPAGNLARWDGSNWSDMGADADNYIFALGSLPDGDGKARRLGIGGCFTLIGGIALFYLALMSGTDYQALTVAALSLYVFTMLTFYHAGSGQTLTLLGGHFRHAGTVYAGMVVLLAYTAGMWQYLFLGSGLGSPIDVYTAGVFCAAVFHGFLYLGGLFSQVGEYRTDKDAVLLTSNIARWGSGEITPTYLSGFTLTADVTTVRADWTVTSYTDTGRFRLVGSSGAESWEVAFLQESTGVFSGVDTSIHLQGGNDFRYRLYYLESGTDWLLLGEETVTMTRDEIPASRLLESYPNPFNPQTNITFELPGPQWARVRIFDVEGRQVRQLADRVFAGGRQTLSWDGLDDAGRELPTGVYILQLETRSRVESQKLALVR